MSRFVVCDPAAAVLPELIDAINGSGPAPAAVTIGGVEIYFEPPTQRLKRHEFAHVVQAARFAPRWAGWLPLRARAWIGAPAFWRAYARGRGSELGRDDAHRWRLARRDTELHPHHVDRARKL